MNVSAGNNLSRKSVNQNIQVYVRVRPINARERGLRSTEVVRVASPREIVTRHSLESKLTKKFTFDRAFGPESRQVDVYTTVVAPMIEEVLAGYNCTVFAYGQTGTGKTHTMVGTESAELRSSWEDDSDIGIIPRALCHLFDELRLMEVDFSMRISYLELYNEELCDLLSNDDNTKIRIFDDATKKGSVIIQGLEERIVNSKDDVYKLLEIGSERRKTATTLMNAQSSRSHTVFSILVHTRETGIEGEEMLKIGKLNLVDLAGSENATKAGNEGMRVRETASINQSLLTLGRVITALVERTPHVPYRESKLTRILQESLGGRTKTSIIATISPGHKDIEETLSTLLYADRAKNIQNKPEINQKLTKHAVIKEYTEEIEKLKRDLIASREKNGIYLAEETYNEMTYKMDSQSKELNEKMLLIKALKEEMGNKERLFSELSHNLVEKSSKLEVIENSLEETKKTLNKTLKRYKEKNIILKSHVKTEKILTNQAVNILQVADVATKDAQQLHHAIERRSNVERQVQSACQQFTERMGNNFLALHDQLNDMETKLKPKLNMVMEKLDDALMSQNTHLNDLTAKIEMMRKCLKAYSAESIDVEKKYSNLLQTLNAEQRDMLFVLLSEQKSIQREELHKIDAGILELKTTFSENSAKLKAVHELLFAELEQNKIEQKLFKQELQSKFEKCINDIKIILDENDKLRQQIDEEYAIAEQERLDRLARFSKTKDVLEYAVNKCKTVESTITSSATTLVTFCDKHETAKPLLTSQLQNEIEGAIKCSEVGRSECEKIVESNELFNEVNKKRIDESIEEIANYYKHIESLENSKDSELKIIQEKHDSLLDEICSNVEKDLSKNTKERSLQLTLASVWNSDVKSNLENYQNDFRKRFDECTSDLDTFSKKEIQTYNPTGATPSRKEFSYPRILASTSPHTKIVERLREENDASDLDLTIINDDESVLEKDFDNPSETIIPEIQYPKVVLNSTPLNINLGNSNNLSSNSISSKKPSARKESEEISGKENIND